MIIASRPVRRPQTSGELLLPEGKWKLKRKRKILCPCPISSRLTSRCERNPSDQNFCCWKWKLKRKRKDLMSMSMSHQLTPSHSHLVDSLVLVIVWALARDWELSRHTYLLYTISHNNNIDWVHPTLTQSSSSNKLDLHHNHNHKTITITQRLLEKVSKMVWQAVWFEDFWFVLPRVQLRWNPPIRIGSIILKFIMG